MRAFVDTNVFIYAGSPESEFHATCNRLLGEELLPILCTSAIVIEELAHFESNFAQARGIAQSAFAALRPLVPVDDEVTEIALRLSGAGLGSADRFHCAVCMKWGLTHIVSADRRFKDVPGIKLVDPARPRQVKSFVDLALRHAL